MRRGLYVLLLVVGVVLVALGGYHVAFPPPLHPLRIESVAPSQTTDALTPGTWHVFGRAGTGLYGSAVVIQVSVTAPNGRPVPVALPSYPATLNAGGVSYEESVTMHIPTAGNYVVSLTPTNSPPIRVLVTKSLHPRFPWDGLTIDGTVLVAVGAAMTAYEKRRRRTQAELEATYAKS
jgi:hypothetical protein